MSCMHLWNSHELVAAQLDEHELPKKLKSHNKQKGLKIMAAQVNE